MNQVLQHLRSAFPQSPEEERIGWLVQSQRLSQNALTNKEATPFSRCANTGGIASLFRPTLS